MGERILDQYSLLHFSSGVVAYFFGVPLWLWIIINVVYEIFENSKFGMDILSNLKLWSDIQHLGPESIVNRFGDLICVILGWSAAYGLDNLNRYSLFLFSLSVVAYFFVVPLWLWIIGNIIYKIWSDTLNWESIISDLICVILGWSAAYGLDYLGTKHGWLKKVKQRSSPPNKFRKQNSSDRS